MFCETPHDLHTKTVWPTDWLERRPYSVPDPPLIITTGVSKFIVWKCDNIYYFQRWFCYRTRWWHLLRPDRATALRAALDWVHRVLPIDDDLALVKEIVKEYEEREQQVVAIDALLNDD